MPVSDDDQTCLDFRLKTMPAAVQFAYDLPTGRVHHFDIRSPHRELKIEAESLVVTHRANPFALLPHTEDDENFYSQEHVRSGYAEYLMPTTLVQLHPETDRIAAVARKQSGPGTTSFLKALTRRLHRVLSYKPGATRVDSSILHVLEKNEGVCQDFAHLMLSICRRQSIPSRYVSGYLFTGRAAEDNESGKSSLNESFDTSAGLISGDAMHAWVECLLPDNRWHGFDPTNNLLTNDHYIKVHFGRDYTDVTPIRGIYRGSASHSLDVTVQIIHD